MPPRQQNATAVRTQADEAVRVKRDHEAIGRLADDLLPALIAKLAASGLGEIEVRENGWKARLRKPAGLDEARRAAAKVPADSHAAHGHASARPAAAHARGTEDRDPRREESEDPAEAEPSLVAATSPAVGVYHPRRDLAVGMHVRAGDRIGWVDVLGVQQDVIAPVDGLIGSSLAEAGEAVEYGQGLVRLDPPEPAGESGGSGAVSRPAAVANS
ncbi:MAG: acetyl-CoA carboxylase biotin carboxyl carrier protein [Candidatus Limnocylindrales bacterium]